MKRIDREECVLVVIDIQGRLAELMTDRDRLFENLVRLIRGAGLLEVPIIWTEQVPEKLGATTEVIRKELADANADCQVGFQLCGGTVVRGPAQRAGAKDRHSLWDRNPRLCLPDGP